MLFNSLFFLFFFLPTVLFVCRPLKGQPLLAAISLTSFVFYALAGEPWFLIPMGVTMTLDFFVAQKMANAKSPAARKYWLWLSLCGNLGLLFYFKYSVLLRSTLLGNFNFFQVLLPAGISFYTFQTLSYVIDVYRGQAPPEKNFWRFSGFVSFFPHLVAGPMTRHHQLIPALGSIAQTGIQPRWKAGLFLFSAGLIKKVLIADRIASFCDPIIGGIHGAGPAAAWIALLGYSLQIYFDFSGYSDMAIGLGRLFGIELPQNFNSPYRALSASDFWRRWHMTLSSWLRDYVFNTFGGASRSLGKRYAALILTMFLGGLWHGANWTFAAWGLYHGMLLVIFHHFKRDLARLPEFAQRAGTFLAVCLGWVFFRSEDFLQAALWYAHLFGLGPRASLLPASDFWALGGLVALGLFIIQVPRNASSYQSWEQLGFKAQVGLGLATALAIVCMNYSSRFLYFQF